MEDLYKDSLKAFPALAIGLGALVAVVWLFVTDRRKDRQEEGTKIPAAIDGLRVETTKAIDGLKAEVSKLGITVAEYSGRTVEALNNSTDAIREMERKRS